MSRRGSTLRRSTTPPSSTKASTFARAKRPVSSASRMIRRAAAGLAGLPGCAAASVIESGAAHRPPTVTTVTRRMGCPASSFPPASPSAGEEDESEGSSPASSARAPGVEVLVAGALRGRRLGPRGRSPPERGQRGGEREGEGRGAGGTGQGAGLFAGRPARCP